MAGALVALAIALPIGVGAALELNSTASDLTGTTGELDRTKCTLESVQDYNRELLDEAEGRKAELGELEAAIAVREAAVGDREAAVQVVEDTISANSFGAGTYQVGDDITAGTYRNDGSDRCYWERLSNGGGGFDGIIARSPSPRGGHSPFCACSREGKHLNLPGPARLAAIQTSARV